jgi:hypothetical protein
LFCFVLFFFKKKNMKASPDIRAKLRFVTKAIRSSPAALGVVVMLATHGGVCHVMKEVGIRAAYEALASIRTDSETNDVANVILQILHNWREVLVEKLYVAQGRKGCCCCCFSFFCFCFFKK